MSKTYSAGIVTAYGAAKRAGYQGTYEDFCRQQAGYAESAATVEQAKNNAFSAANTATKKAGEAITAATAAQTAKIQTEAAASQALTDISTARSGAISAVQTEGQTQTANARAQAQAAAQSATTASTKASEASASATSAGQSATNAAASATSAAQSASNAQNVLDSIPADYSDLSANVSQLQVDLKSVEESLSNGFIRIANRYIVSDGTLGFANAYDVLCFRVLPSMTIEKIVSTDIIVYGFYAVEPTTEAVTYNSSRVVTSGSTITNVTVPQTCYWIGVRVPTGTTATITPNSFVIKYIENYLDALDQNYEVTTTYSSGVVHTSGVNPNNDVSHSDYVEVEPFNVYRIDNIYRNDNNIIIYYNANKEYIMAEKLPRQLSQTISSFVFSVPSGVAYMRFNVTNANLSTVKITRIVNTEINDTPIYLGTFTAGYINANNKVTTSTALSYSNYINVTYGKTLVIKKAYPQSVRMIFMYDADKNYIGSININVTGSSVEEFLFTVPNTCAYIRFNVTNGNTSSVSLAYRVSTYAGSHNESSVFVNDFLKTVGAKVNSPFATIKSAGPLCVIIDDDTSSIYQVDKFHDLCERNAVVGVYACITSYLDSISGMESKLLNYEKEGFQTIVHCTQQTRIYDPTNEMYSVSAMESDFINACHRMHEAGFYDWKYWAYPYGTFTNEHIRIARKTGMKCAMTVPNLEYIGFTDAVTDIRGRYTMKRMELYPTDTAGNQTLSDIKNQMDLCAKNNGLLIICTHMHQWDEQSDFTRFDQMVQYGKAKGLRFTTISEAMSYWKHLYDLYEAF